MPKNLKKHDLWYGPGETMPHLSRRLGLIEVNWVVLRFLEMLLEAGLLGNHFDLFLVFYLVVDDSRTFLMMRRLR
jgi:hypothetical protein